MHTDPRRPTTKANLTNRKDWRHYGLTLAVLCMLAVSARAQCTTPKFNLSLYYGGQTVTINTLVTNATTTSPCAWADAVSATSNQLAAENFLACPLPTNGNPIALCYYSGKPGAPQSTPRCTLSQGGNAAECNCYEISNNVVDFTGQYSYVEITAILNQTMYTQTLKDCPFTSGINECLTAWDVIVLHDTKSKKPAATLCPAITNKPNGLFPGADLISDFFYVGPSPVHGIPAPLSTPQSCGSSLYAGCMTAPCKHTNKIDPLTKLPLAQCTCPTFNGPNQVGNPQIQGPPVYSCTPTPYVWSSANTQIN